MACESYKDTFQIRQTYSRVYRDHLQVVISHEAVNVNFKLKAVNTKADHTRTAVAEAGNTFEVVSCDTIYGERRRNKVWWRNIYVECWIKLTDSRPRTTTITKITTVPLTDKLHVVTWSIHWSIQALRSLRDLVTNNVDRWNISARNYCNLRFEHGLQLHLSGCMQCPWFNHLGMYFIYLL